MSALPKNYNVLGVAMVFLLVRSRGKGLLPPLNLSTFTRAFSAAHFSRDLHRIVDMMDRLEGLGQLARPQKPAAFPVAVQGNGQNALPDALMNAFNGLSAADMAQLTQMAGPLLQMLGNGQG